MKNNISTPLIPVNYPYSKVSKMKNCLLSLLLLFGFYQPLIAQDSAKFSRPSFFIGLAAGANINFYAGSTQRLTDDFMVPTAFHKGSGMGLYVAPLLEYHKPESRWGFMFQAGYDNRKGKFKQVTSPCNCPADLSTNLTYVTFEPSLRFAPFKSDFYLYGGPRIALAFDQSFKFQQGTNPDIPEQVANPGVNGNFSKMNATLLSMQIGAGYDIYLSSQNKSTQFVISPFVAYHPYMGQDPRSIETWNVSTLRVGATIKFGSGKNTRELKDTANKEKHVALAAGTVPSKVVFGINAPKNIPEVRTVNETFPIRNYIFFDLGSTQISNRYVKLNKKQAKEFEVDHLELNTPQNLSGRSERQLLVYYNIINILGDRMIKNSNTNITLVGSSAQGPEDGKLMSESVKVYLVNVFDINPSRITVEGRSQPKIPSLKPSSTSEFELLKEGDRRVSIETSSPSLLMEFQSGPSAPLKPVGVLFKQEAPVESYLTFTADGAKNEFTSWSLEVKDEKGGLQYFGPYTEDKISIPGKAILGDRPEGDYQVTMIGKTKKGELVKKETSMHIVLWIPPVNEEVLRFSVIYEFNESKALKQYDKYLTEIVMPKIPKGAKVVIQGHTDVIGNEEHNRTLSLARANDVNAILERVLAKAGRNDVKLEVYGFGEDTDLAPFENKFPEQRFYNRTVIIDIIPQ